MNLTPRWLAICPRWLPLLLLPFLAGLTPSRAATAADFVGLWTWYRPEASNERSVRISVDPYGILSGVWCEYSKEYPLHNLSVSGETLRFQYTVQASGPVVYSYTLNLAGELTEMWSIPGQINPSRYTAVREGAPVITQQPVFVPSGKSLWQVNAGETVGLSLIAASATPMTFQWRQEGIPISGATQSTLTLSNVQIAQEGYYTCVVRNDIGPVITTQAALDVVPRAGSSDADFLRPVFPWVINSGPTVSIVINPYPVSGPPQMKVLVMVWSGSTSAASNGGPNVVIAAAGSLTSGLSNAISAKPGTRVNFRAGAEGSRPMTAQWTKDGVAIPGATDDELDLPSPTISDSGTYGCTVTNRLGTDHWALTLTVAPGAEPPPPPPPPPPPVIAPPNLTLQPKAVTVVEGQPWSVETGVSVITTSLTFQWYRDGVPLVPVSGADAASDAPSGTNRVYSVAAASLSDAGSYYCVVSNSGGSVTTESVKVTVLRPGRIVNISSRVWAGGPAGAPICGFVIRGSENMPVIVRAVGPTLATTFGMPGTLPEPSIRLVFPGGAETSFKGWGSALTDAMNAVGAFPLATGSRDAVHVASLAPASYSVIAADAAGRDGVLLLETYDATTVPTNVRLVNASTRGFVGTGDRMLITGFVVSGSTDVKVLVRAVGPKLKVFGVGDAIDDPKIEVYRDKALVGANDNWNYMNHIPPILVAVKQVGAFPLDPGSKDAVVLLTLNEGSYSAVISGVGGTTGTALVELYVVP